MVIVLRRQTRGKNLQNDEGAEFERVVEKSGNNQRELADRLNIPRVIIGI